MKFSTKYNGEQFTCDRMFVEASNGEILSIEERNGEVVVRCSNDDHRMVIQPTAANQFSIVFVER